jgi:hypothetical protein
MVLWGLMPLSTIFQLLLVTQENNYDINLLSKHTNNRLKELVLLSFMKISRSTI